MVLENGWSDLTVLWSERDIIWLAGPISNYLSSRDGLLSRSLDFVVEYIGWFYLLDKF